MLQAFCLPSRKLSFFQSPGAMSNCHEMLQILFCIVWEGKMGAWSLLGSLSVFPLLPLHITLTKYAPSSQAWFLPLSCSPLLSLNQLSSVPECKPMCWDVVPAFFFKQGIAFAVYCLGSTFFFEVTVKCLVWQGPGRSWLSSRKWEEIITSKSQHSWSVPAECGSAEVGYETVIDCSEIRLMVASMRWIEKNCLIVAAVDGLRGTHLLRNPLMCPCSCLCMSQCILAAIHWQMRTNVQQVLSEHVINQDGFLAKRKTAWPMWLSSPEMVNVIPVSFFPSPFISLRLSSPF